MDKPSTFPVRIDTGQSHLCIYDYLKVEIDQWAKCVFSGSKELLIIADFTVRDNHRTIAVSELDFYFYFIKSEA